MLSSGTLKQSQLSGEKNKMVEKVEKSLSKIAIAPKTSVVIHNLSKVKLSEARSELCKAIFLELFTEAFSVR